MRFLFACQSGFIKWYHSRVSVIALARIAKFELYTGVILSNIDRKSVIEANRYVHSKIGDKYNDSPHFRPENQERVSQTIQQLVERLGESDLKAEQAIDFCCGTGFIINLISCLFERIVGVDVTQEMLDQVDTSSGNIELFNCLAEDVPFEDGQFSFATAYSCLDHLTSVEDFFAEAYRVLKPNGILYVDLNPNRAYWKNLKSLENQSIKSRNLQREVFNTLNNDKRNSDLYDLDIEQLVLAEPSKNFDFGFDPSEVENTAKKIGFRHFETRYHWFINQALVAGESPQETTEAIDAHLQSVLPASAGLYKYLAFVAQK